MATYEDYYSRGTAPNQTVHLQMNPSCGKWEILTTIPKEKEAGCKGSQEYKEFKDEKDPLPGRGNPVLFSQAANGTAVVVDQTPAVNDAAAGVNFEKQSPRSKQGSSGAQ